jgi:DNA sulfur modification protein DndB
MPKTNQNPPLERIEIGPATFPCIRAQMGTFEYFISTMTLTSVAKWIKKPKHTAETDKDFKTWLQREIDPKRLAKIAKYLYERDQRFFNAIVVGIFGGDPDWYPVVVSPGGPDELILDERTKDSIGILKLQGGEQAFSIDGQHRVEAIKEALKDHPKLGNDELAVIFISHHTNAEGRKRTRRLFSTLNKYAKPVSKGEIVALDEDDAFAIVTRELTDKYPPLRGLITYTKTANLPTGDTSGVTTTVGLYELLHALPRTSRVSPKTLEDGPAEKHEKEIGDLYRTASRFWDILNRAIPDVAQVLGSAPSKKLAGKQRQNGGNMLFRPAGQQAFARAVTIMVKGGMKMEVAIEKLSKIELNIHKEPWPGILWNKSRNTMILIRKPLMHNMLLHLVGHQLSPRDYDLLGEFRKAKDDENAALPS